MKKMKPRKQSGLCLCGCGQNTPLARYNDGRCGQVKGEPIRYCFGHAGGAARAPDVGVRYVPTPEQITAACEEIRAGRAQRGEV